MACTANLPSHPWLLCEFVLDNLLHIIWGLVSIIRIRGNHENYGLLVHYSNKYLPNANKNNIYCMSGKQKDTVLASSEFIVCGLYCYINIWIVSKCKIIATSVFWKYMHNSRSVNTRGNDQVREVREGLSEEVVADQGQVQLLTRWKETRGEDMKQFSSVQFTECL